MNKKLNTVLFVLGATVVNVLIMLVILTVGLVLVSRLLPESAQQHIGQILFIVVFIVAIAGSFFAYNRLIKFISRKIDMDKYFDPIFRSKKK